ncbi:hypothetical protein IGI49_004476 [Enterococcus sp. AZ071]
MTHFFNQQVFDQLQAAYISDYATGDRYLTFDHHRSYHFRMNLSYYYESITAKTLKKTVGIVRELIDSIFSDEQTIVIAQYIYQRKQLKKLLDPSQIRLDRFCSLLFEQGTLRLLEYSSESPLILQKIGASLVYQDFSNLNPGYPHLVNPTILINLRKEIVLHIYDDRGCDVFCKEERDYLALTNQFQPYIESYTRDMMQLDYTVLTSPYGVHFTK